MKNQFKIKSSHDADMDMLPAWAAPLIVTFMLTAGLAIQATEKEPVKPPQKKPECRLLVASQECK